MLSRSEITALLVRLSLGFVYLSAGWAKFAPDNVGNLIGPVDLTHVTDSQTILLAFKFIAIFQMAAGALVLSHRWSLAGLIALFPLAFGIFVFTLVAGFGGTPIINLFLLILACLALNEERGALKRLSKGEWSVLWKPESPKQFLNSGLPCVAFVLLLLLVLLSQIGGITMNLLATAAVVAFVVNLYQFKKFLLIDHVLICMFFAVAFVTTNGILLNQLVPRFFFVVFYIILSGFFVYFVRLGFWKIGPGPMGE